MDRRHFFHKCLVIAGVVTGAGCVGAGDLDEEGGDDDGEGDEGPGSFPSFDIPEYSTWIPSESHDTDPDVFFIHVDWEAMAELDTDEDPEEEDDELGEVVEQIPIIGLPLYGALISPLALFGLLFYPFVEHILPDNGHTEEGIETSAMTWTDDVLIFHGSYDPATFEEQYSDGFDIIDERDEFTIYSGVDVFTEGLVYAVSEEAVVAGMLPGEDGEYDVEQLVNDSLDRNLGELDRLLDDEDGHWLFETTGDAQMVFGGWNMDDLMEAIEPDEDLEEEVDDAEPDTEPDVEDNPVFDHVESQVNNISYTVEAGEMRDIEARFSGLYPDDQVPSEGDVREYLLGDSDVPHDVVIDGNRVHATATFEEPTG